MGSETSLNDFPKGGGGLQCNPLYPPPGSASDHWERIELQERREYENYGGQFWHKMNLRVLDDIL